MACFFEVFRTLLKCSPIWAQKANACTILELSRLFWYPYHLWKWLSSGDIAVFKIFLQIFLLQRHLVTVFHKWKINFKVFLIDLVPFRYFFHAFWWPNQKKCLVDFSRDTSLWKESTENLSVWGVSKCWGINIIGLLAFLMFSNVFSIVLAISFFVLLLTWKWDQT